MSQSKEEQFQFKDYFKIIFRILLLKDLAVSKKRKSIFIVKILLLFILIYLKINFPQAWISYGILPAFLEIVLFYVSLDLIIYFFRMIFVSIYRAKHKIETDVSDNFIVGVDKLAFFLTQFIFIVSLLYFFGVNLQLFLTTLGLFAVGIALIFKEVLSNILSGFIIMFSNEVKLKEYIQVNNFKGRVVELNFLNVELKTDDGDIVYIPNMKFLTEDLINYSKSSIKRVKYDFNLDFVFFGEVDKLEFKLSNALNKEFDTLVLPENVIIKVNQIASNRVSLTLEVIVSRFNFKVEQKVLQFSSRFILKFIHKEKKKLEKIENLKEVDLTKE